MYSTKIYELCWGRHFTAEIEEHINYFDHQIYFANIIIKISYDQVRIIYAFLFFKVVIGYGAYNKFS